MRLQYRVERAAALRVDVQFTQVKRAARLLRSTNLPLSEVAARSAFGNRTTLHRAVKSAFGVSPTEYRSRFQR